MDLCPNDPQHGYRSVAPSPRNGRPPQPSRKKKKKSLKVPELNIRLRKRCAGAAQGQWILLSKGDAPLRIDSHVSTAHTRTTHAHTSCARLPSWCNERGWQIARPQTRKRDRTLPRTRAAPKFGLFIHLGTGTRCPHSACLARHTPVLTRSAKYSRHQHS